MPSGSSRLITPNPSALPSFLCNPQKRFLRGGRNKDRKILGRKHECRPNWDLTHAFRAAIQVFGTLLGCW